MPGFAREHLRPLAGSAGLHLLLVAAMAVATLRWTTPPPPVQLAIEGVVVDSRSLPESLRAGRPKPQPAPEPEPMPEPAAPAPAAEPPPDPVKAPDDEVKASERAAEEAALQAKEKAEAKKTAEAQRKAKAEEAERRKATDTDAKRKQQDEAKAAQDAKVKADREADLKRRLAAEAAEEEGAAAMARSGVVDEYRTLLAQAIERSWIRPPSAKAGLECTLHVSQAPGGTVVDVKLGACNGDQSVRESIVNAVYRASPLPAPRDPRAFERRLEIVFRPTE
jgi:colicin import membrane protein